MSKVLTLTDLALAARAWRRAGATVVLATGAWDPIHPGHVLHLEAARELGNVLVVGVASDRVVRAYKQAPGGPRRPLMSDADRAIVMAGLRCVDAVAINDACCELIEAVRPHVYCKGAEYKGHLTPDLERELELLTRQGGRLAFVSGHRVMSSTAIIKETCAPLVGAYPSGV